MNNIDIEQYDIVDINNIINTQKKIKMNDIQVDDNATFIIDNGILTHNSAIASFTEIRNPETQAGMPLRGKVLNVYGKAPIDAMDNAEVADIVTAINLEFNEQMGDWLFGDKVELYDVKFESIFEVDTDGEAIIKNVVVNINDKFHINKRWITVGELYKNTDKLFNTNIKEITLADVNITLADVTVPDYFHFRRAWDFRGFRKSGIKYSLEIGKNKFVCNDLDEVLIDKKWYKVSNLNKKCPKFTQAVKITKSNYDTKPTNYHKLVKPAFDTKLKYGKIYIATDADPDGSAINNLLVNLLHEYFPELFWNPDDSFVNRIIFPMISATKSKKIKYYSNRKEYDVAREKKEIDDSWKITYFKGLGSMEKNDWEHVFSNLEKYSFNIVDDGQLDQLMQIFFDDDASVRKIWLSTE